MKFSTIFLAMTLLAAPALAGTPITEESALKYYDNCLVNAEKDGTMGEESRKSYCFCTANQMKNTMSQEDLSAMGSKDPERARAAVNKVIVDVNTPCTQYPLHDKVYNQCMTTVGNEATCSCLSRNISAYIKEKSKEMMAKILRQNPNIYDPMGAIMETEDYKSAEQKIALDCATNPNN